MVTPQRTRYHLVTNIEKRLMTSGVSYMLDGYVAKTSLKNRIDYENYLEFKYKFSDKLSLTNLFDYNARGIEFYKMKIGLEYKI